MEQFTISAMVYGPQDLEGLTPIAVAIDNSQ